MIYHQEERQQNMINQCIEIINGILGADTPLYFDHTLIVKKSPHTVIYRIYGCIVTQHNELKILGYDDDGKEHWNQIMPLQSNVDFILYSLLGELKSLFINKQTPSLTKPIQ